MRVPLLDSTPAQMDRSGDEQVDKSAPHHWVEAHTRFLEGCGEICKGAFTAPRSFTPPEKAQDNTPDINRNNTVIFRNTKRITTPFQPRDTPQHGQNRPRLGLPHITYVAGTKSGVAPLPAPPSPRFKRLFAVVRREGLAQTYSVFRHKPTKHVKALTFYQKPTKIKLKP